MSIGIEIQYDSKTGQQTVIDNRIFSECVAFQLKHIRDRAGELILAAAPEHKQRNAALGLLSEEETQALKDHIQSTRNQSNEKESQILAVSWDGQEATRSAACDAVQAVVWD
jgi:hypothetical protein